MAIIGTVPSRFSTKNQQLYKGCVFRKKYIFPSKVSPRVTFKFTGHLKGWIERYTNNPTKTSKNCTNWSSTSTYIVYTSDVDNWSSTSTYIVYTSDVDNWSSTSTYIVYTSDVDNWVKVS
jgi:hypothetical protein